MYSNFSFIMKKYPQTYRHLATAEKSIRLNKAVNEIRYALEKLVEERLKTLGIGDLFQKYATMHKINKYLSLQDQISICLDVNILKEIGYESKEPVLPKLNDKITCYFMNNRKAELKEYDFLRIYGNSKGHSKQSNLIKINYQLSLKALKVFHKILCVICNSTQEEQRQQIIFNENMMPIQTSEHLYEIDGFNKPPSDAPLSKCQIEFKAHFVQSGSIKRTEYALIRQYKKSDVDEKFLLRNIDTIRKTTDERIDDNLPPCMRHPVELSPIENANSPFYIVAYHFPQAPQSLSDALLKNFDMKTRLSICTDLARCMVELHAMGIYQRMLSYASVYVCDYSERGKGWRPHLVKFDFAKLEQKQGKDYGTVMPWVQEAKTKIKDGSIKKYINVKDWEQEQWEKTDIYALGILFCDILSGRINNNYSQMEDAVGELFKAQQLSDEFADFLESMLDDNAENRPSAMETQRMMEAEMGKWN